MADTAELLRSAVARHRSGDLAGAVSGYRAVLQAGPERASVLQKLALALCALGEWREALGPARRLTERRPQEALSWLLLGRCAEETGAVGEAILAYRRATSLDPANGVAAMRARRLLLSQPRPATGSGRKVCLYTAIFGDYDRVFDPAPQTVECDYVLITDRAGVVPPPAVWKVVVVDTFRLVPMHPRYAAKYFKIMGHEFFRFLSRLHFDAGLHAYDQLVWVDGSVRITSPDFVAFMIGSIGKNGLAFLRHPTRDCIYDEARWSAGMAKYRGLPLREQVEHYRARGYPAHRGLMAGTVFARDLRRPEVDRLFEAWWEENLKWTFQDQLSLPYVLWKHGRWYDEIDLSLLDNPYFTWEVFKRRKSSKMT